jgi:hypothetical protein
MRVKKFTVLGFVEPGYDDSGWATQTVLGLPEETDKAVKTAIGDGVSKWRVLESTIVEIELDSWFKCRALTEALRNSL